MAWIAGLVLAFAVGLAVHREGRAMPRIRAAETAPDPSRSPGSLVWERRGAQVRGRVADLGAIAVPMRRGAASGELLHLPVVRYRCTGAGGNPPIFHLTGGPGMSNLGLRPSEELLAHADVVLVGYRGVDGSVRLDGPEVSAAMRRARAIDSAEARAALRDAARAMLARHRAAGVDLEGFTIPEVAADLDAVREALGYERVSLVSESYGTRVAQVYAAEHPERVARAVMVGVNPPGHFVWDPADTDAILAEHARACAADPGCARRTSDLPGTVREVLARLPARWLFVRLDPGRVKSMLFVLLFHRRTAALGIDAVLDAKEGDHAGLALLSLGFDLALSRAFLWGDFLVKAIGADLDPARDYGRELEASSGGLGSPLSRYFFSHASELGIAPLDVHHRRARPSDVETLFIGGNLDLSTPPDHFREELVPLHARSRALVLRDAGHVGDLWHGREDGDRRIVRFLAHGEVEAPPDEPLRYGVPVSASTLMKGTLGLVGLLALGLLGLLALGLSWFARRLL